VEDEGEVGVWGGGRGRALTNDLIDRNMRSTYKSHSLKDTTT
jgi:hypothetical protein